MKLKNDAKRNQGRFPVTRDYNGYTDPLVVQVFRENSAHCLYNDLI